jgi:cellulose synthase/poly-beta-1,6-N-acetylglucosamine synthase-like glycosyltransferase
MASFVSYFLVTFAVLLAIPVAMFLLEIVSAFILPARETALRSKSNIRQRAAVLIPAHNESTGLLSTLEDIKAQLLTGDRLLVVADNCIDDTAAVAAAAGAELIERHEPTRIGKDYALDFGFKHLGLDPPAVVIIIDADCRVEEGAIDLLAKTCAMTNRPVQALDLMTSPDDSPINYCAAEFAWRLKNWVRPLGLHALNLPCQLMGTGMAFPWEIISSANLASGSIVEDIKLGLDLAHKGRPPIFCPSAVVTSHFPLSTQGAGSQRERWEEGHIGMILSSVPGFIYKAIARGNLDLLVLALDLAIPPLSLLVILLAAMCALAGLAILFGFSSTALIISATCFMALVLATFLSWFKYGRDILPPRAILSVISYVIAKLPIYRRVLSGSAASQWTRTDRKKDE